MLLSPLKRKDAKPSQLKCTHTPNDFPSSMTVAHTGETTFNSTEPDGSNPVACSVDAAGSYTCDAVRLEEDTGVGAVLQIETVLNGVATDPLSITAGSASVVTCDGGGCVLLEIAGLRFPCNQDVSFTVTAP